MPSNAKPSTQRVLKPEDDWTRVKDPRQKKRIQNRVAQRTYRHRMKARMGELQARLEEQEKLRLARENEDAAQRASSIEAMAHHGFATSSAHQTRALPHLDTNVYNHNPVKQESYSAYPPSGSPYDAIPRSLSASSGLLSPPSNSERSSALTPDALTCSTSQYADTAVLPMLDDLSSIPQVTGTQSMAPTSLAAVSTSSPHLNEPHASLAESMSFFNSPLDHVTARSMVDPSQGLTSTSAWANPSQPIEASYGSSSKWDPWEGTNLQQRVLKAMESVIRVEGAEARSDLMSQMAPLVEHCDSNGAYSAGTLAEMEQIMQKDLWNSWTIVQAIGANGGNTWRTDRTNIPLAGMLLMNLGGQIPREKLLGLIGACL